MQKTHSFRANALRTSVSLALAAGMTTGAGVAFAQDGATATEGRVEVTGSRIKRADLEGALPVTVIDREQIELSGQTSVADLLRNTSLNSFGSFRPQSGSSAQSFAGLSLRGLGTGRTLILIDGRRAPIAPNVGSAQDLNAIPLGAVERIEILSDGASAIYGTDAIGGVVNIITRRDFNGAELRYGRGNPTRPGGDTEEGAIMFGASSDRASVTGGISFNNRQIIFQRDRAWSTGGASVFSNNFLTFGSAFLTHGINGSVVPGGCSAAGFRITTVAAPTTLTAAQRQRCLYDFTALAADEADIRNRSMFLRSSIQINDDWSAHMNAGLSRVQSFGRYAPVPSSPWPGGFPQLLVGTPNHPGTIGGNNPNAADYQAVSGNYNPANNLRFIHRFAALGPRDTSTDANVYDLQLTFQGRIGAVDLDFGVRQTDSQYYDLGRNYVVGGLAQQFITSGQYNIYNPFANDPTIMSAMIATINRDARFLQREGFVTGSVDLPFEMAGGVVSSAFGIEYRDENYKDIYDTLASSNQIVGSAGNSAAGNRNVSAAYFEVLLPVTSEFEATVAGRYDEYSDYGSDFSPKLAVRWQPLDNFTVRASWGKGFAAPSLDIISQAPSFGAAGTNHPPTLAAFGIPSTGSTQVTTYSIANPNITSENSTQWSIGMAWDATDWFNMNLDYYDVEITDRVAGIGINTIAQCIRPGDWTNPTQNCPPGLQQFAPTAVIPNAALGLGIAFDPTTGQILFGQTGFTNLGTIRTTGLDFQARTNFDFGNYGRLQNQLQIGMVNKFIVDSGANVIDGAGAPKYRGTLQNRWSIGDFMVAWNVNYIHKQPGGGYASWTTHDLQVNYYAPWNARMTVGVNNLANKDPILDNSLGRGFNFSLYDGYGRVPYIRYVQTF